MTTEDANGRPPAKLTHESRRVAEAHRERLLLEATLAASCLGGGLTDLRQYSFADKGRFFAGLFGVTVGLERTLKLSVILDHVVRLGRPPSQKELKDLGHGLDILLGAVRGVNAAHDLGIDEAPLSDPLSARVVELLTQFARQSRYYNLNVVAGDSREDMEPLATWTRDVCQEIIRRHHITTARARANQQLADLANGVPGIVVSHLSDDALPIRDLGSYVAQSALVETKQKYTVFYIHRIALFCMRVLERLDFAFPLYVSEPFRWLDTGDRQTILRRKRWNRTS